MAGLELERPEDNRVWFSVGSRCSAVDEPGQRKGDKGRGSVDATITHWYLRRTRMSRKARVAELAGRARTCASQGKTPLVSSAGTMTERGWTTRSSASNLAAVFVPCGERRRRGSVKLGERGEESEQKTHHWWDHGRVDVALDDSRFQACKSRPLGSYGWKREESLWGFKRRRRREDKGS